MPVRTCNTLDPICKWCAKHMSLTQPYRWHTTFGVLDGLWYELIGYGIFDTLGKIWWTWRSQMPWSRWWECVFRVPRGWPWVPAGQGRFAGTEPQVSLRVLLIPGTPGLCPMCLYTSLVRWQAKRRLWLLSCVNKMTLARFRLGSFPSFSSQ